MAKKNSIHRESNKTTEWFSWVCMHRRCKDPKNSNFQWYGQQGIAICERWESYKNFLKDMGRKPTRKHTLDRIDGSLDYSPENCRWTTMTEQARNKKNNRILIYKSKKQCLSAWAEEFGINRLTLIGRLDRGWSVQSALETKVKTVAQNRMLTHNGKTKCVSAWARESGISKRAIYARLNRGWSVEKALTEPLKR